jgi:hypothetical protein
LHEGLPLVGTLGKSGIECAAAALLFALHKLGREWSAPIAVSEIAQVLSAAIDAGEEPVRTWSRNPFLRPDWGGLVARGFALREQTLDGLVLTLTSAALERVAAHLVPEPCRRCSECVPEWPHHWMTYLPECPEGAEPFYPCKHCDARAAVCEGCDGPVFPRVSNQLPLCAGCRVEGA